MAFKSETNRRRQDRSVECIFSFGNDCALRSARCGQGVECEQDAALRIFWQTQGRERNQFVRGRYPLLPLRRKSLPFRFLPLSLCLSPLPLLLFG